MKILVFVLFLFLPLIGGKISAIFAGDIGLHCFSGNMDCIIFAYGF